MTLGYIGLGKMGSNMVIRLLEKKYDVVVYDANKDAVRQTADMGAQPASSLQELTSLLAAPRLIWVMVPHGVFDAVLNELQPHLQAGDTVIDGGNSFYKDSARRAETLKKIGVHFLDVGVSGGPQGAREGAALMIGGGRGIFKIYEPFFKDIAAEHAYGYMGPSGAGHLVKMVHNGIEYGMVQAIAEGFAILKQSPMPVSLEAITEVYSHQTVIESRLINWLKGVWRQHGEDLEGVSGSAEQTGSGEWTVATAREIGVEAPIIEASVKFRKNTYSKPSFAGKIITALRNQFGGHGIHSKIKI